jgi:hypothetical protein
MLTVSAVAGRGVVAEIREVADRSATRTVFTADVAATLTSSRVTNRTGA